MPSDRGKRSVAVLKFLNQSGHRKTGLFYAAPFFYALIQSAIHTSKRSGRPFQFEKKGERKYGNTKSAGFGIGNPWYANKIRFKGGNL